MAPRGYVCYGFERVGFWGVGRKSRNFSEQMENNYLSGPRWLAGWEVAIWRRFSQTEENKARRRRRNFSKVDFIPFPGPVWLKPLRKRTQRAEKHLLVQFERHLGVAMR